MGLPAPPWQRRDRTRPARTPLSRDLIVDTAVKLLDRDGLDGMSMRGVAQELGTGPASLYAHVANLRELQDLVFDRVVGEVPLPTVDPSHWREQLKQLLLDSLEVLRRHNGVARLGLGRVPTHEHAMAHAETVLALLRAGKVPDQYAAWAVDMLGLYVAGAAYEETLELAAGQNPESIRAWFDQFGEYMASLPADRFPNLVRMASFMVRGDGDDRVNFALDIIIDGLAATGPSE
jgi:AcrR family transcriptional regulator